jgi:enoyl-CoA hydratase/carnithine racemase
VKLDVPNDSVTLQVLEPHVTLVTINRPAARNAELRTLSETAQDRVMRTEDFREGPKAFIETRAPNWVGR